MPPYRVGQFARAKAFTVTNVTVRNMPFSTNSSSSATPCLPPLWRIDARSIP